MRWTATTLLFLPATTAAAAQETIPDAVALLDRWGIKPAPYPLNEPGALYDPYHQNVLKGDYPILGQDVFLILTGRSETLLETRQLPTPSGVSTFRPNSRVFFGEGEQFAVAQTLLATVELFEGDTAFRPRDWELRLTGAVNFNFADVEELAAVRPDVRRGTNRYDQHAALQEASFEYHLADLSDDYDFLSIRVGIQPFVSDFRGFLFNDTNLGARLLGSALSNRLQWNLAAFDQLEKDTNSDLNTFFRRDQQIYIANLYVQDFLTLGYTAQASLHYSHDDAGVEFDDNDFLVRPDLVGSVRPHDVDAVYLGWTGDGHWGRLNVSHALYRALGDDARNPIAGRQADAEALLAAAELSWDFDWLRLRGSFLFASGDDDPTDRRATGFDSIFEGLNFAGGPFSFWNRQAVRLLGVNLTNRLSVLPDLRSSKTQGQINFVNPGLLLGNLGLDVEVTPQLKAILNGSYLRFHRTEPLEALVHQSGIDRELGFDASLGLVWRPLLSNNIVLTGGAAGFWPGTGFEEIYEDDDVLYSAFLQLVLVY
jgi:hypothetical protein